jgi:hypothetical protein
MVGPSLADHTISCIYPRKTRKRQKKDKEAKVSTARTLWVPAVNNHGGFGRWAFIEITDPWDAQTSIRKFVAELSSNEPVGAN